MHLRDEKCIENMSRKVRSVETLGSSCVDKTEWISVNWNVGM